jgi:hypothetical protein
MPRAGGNRSRGRTTQPTTEKFEFVRQPAFFGSDPALGFLPLCSSLYQSNTRRNCPPIVRPSILDKALISSYTSRGTKMLFQRVVSIYACPVTQSVYIYDIIGRYIGLQAPQGLFRLSPRRSELHVADVGHFERDSVLHSLSDFLRFFNILD